MSLAYWVHKLNESNSRLHKEDVIRQVYELAILGNTESKMFLHLVSRTYNPFVTFGVKQVPEISQATGRENPWLDFNQLLFELEGRNITGNNAHDAIEKMSMRFDSDEWNNFCRNVIRKDLRCGISDKTFNKIVKDSEYEIPVFGCQLATNCEGRPEMKGKKRLEPKLDGVRVLAFVNGIDRCFYSRNGKPFENFDHIGEQIQQNFDKLTAHAKDRTLTGGFWLDGEVTGRSFQELMRQARRKEDVNASDSVFNVFDIIPHDDFERGYWNTPLHKRIGLLERLRSVFDSMPNVELLPHIDVDLSTNEGVNQLQRYAKDMVNLGFEGIMVKSLHAPYECTRNTHWMKWKPVYDYDLTVVSIEEGTGKNAGRMGALVCEGVDDGKHITVNVGSGYTDEERQLYWNDKSLVIGQTAVVIADAITQNRDGTYSLRFPRFKTFRDDK
jgi:DNA ligase-1